MHRFFVEGERLKESGPLVISDPALFHQLKDVLRMKPGELVMLLDHTGYECESEILTLEKDKAKFRILSKKKNTAEPQKTVILYQAIPKKTELFEMVLQKGTEIGVKKFVPLLTARTERKTLPKKERMLRILKEAAEQSGRGIIPELEEPQKFQDVVKNLKASAYLFDSKGENFSREKIKETMVAVLIGPEGGFTDEEIYIAQNQGIRVVSLGPRTLRTETAGIVIPAILLLQDR